MFTTGDFLKEPVALRFGGCSGCLFRFPMPLFKFGGCSGCLVRFPVALISGDFVGCPVLLRLPAP